MNNTNGSWGPRRNKASEMKGRDCKLSGESALDIQSRYRYSYWETVFLPLPVLTPRGISTGKEQYW